MSTEQINNYINYLNCEQACISSMLVQNGFNIETMWKQAGLILCIIEGRIHISPFFRSISTDLLENNNILIEERLYKKGEIPVLIQDIDKSVASGGFISVSVDSYYLEYYSPYYLKKHSYHMLEVTDSNDDYYKISDYPLGYHGEINKNKLIKSIYSLNKHFESVPIKTISFKNNNNDNNKTKIDVKTILKDYSDIMSGKLIYDLKPYLNQNNIDTYYVGLSSIPVIKEYIIELLKKDKSDELYLEYIFRSLQQVSNSRFLLFKLLEYYNYYNASLFMDLYQNWTVCTNMFARHYLKGDLQNSYSRIEKRFDSLYELEQNVLEEVQKGLN